MVTNIVRRKSMPFYLKKKHFMSVKLIKEKC